MTLIRNTFWGIENREQIAIERIKSFEPPEGYYLAFSGGKDSIVVKFLVQKSEVKFDTHYNLTTIDPPELVRFIREKHKDVSIDKPDEPFLRKLIKKGFPMRHSRWCCQYYKEKGGEGRFVITGIRWAESFRRKKRMMIETCFRLNGKNFLHPIIDWTDGDIWAFIHKYAIPYCKLYDNGWQRIGCLFCPMASTKQRYLETQLYPKYAKSFIIYFQKLYEQRKVRNRKSIRRWKNGEEMFWWWIQGKAGINKEIQFTVFD